MGSGKTTCTDYLIKLIPNSICISFANSLKDDVVNLGLTPDGKINKARDRKILQQYGGFRRGEIPEVTINNVVFNQVKDRCYPDYWIDMTKEQLFKHRDKNIFVDDIRRIDEANMLRQQGFIIVKIEIGDGIRINRITKRDGHYDSSTAKDVSETEIDSIERHMKVNNDGPLNCLYTQLHIFDTC